MSWSQGSDSEGYFWEIYEQWMVFREPTFKQLSLDIGVLIDLISIMVPTQWKESCTTNILKQGLYKSAVYFCPGQSFSFFCLCVCITCYGICYDGLADICWFFIVLCTYDQLCSSFSEMIRNNSDRSVHLGNGSMG